MNFKENQRHFLILYTNGETFFFTIDKNGFIYCQEFNNLHKFNTGIYLPIATSIKFKDNDFELKSLSGETIYSLKQYRNVKGIKNEVEPTIEMFYIDPDIKYEIIERKKITFSKNIKEIPGLITDEELKELTNKYKIKSYTRTKRRTNLIFD